MIRSCLKYILVTTFTLCALAATTLRADTIVFSENFETATVALGVTTAGQFSAINGTNVDVVGPADGFGYLCAPPESGNCVDMGGTGGDAVGQIQLTTPLNLAAGVYDLSFDLIGSQRGISSETTVTFGSYSQTFTLASGDDTDGIVINQAVTITGGPTQLSFVDDGANNNVGALLDDVVITSPATSVTPEPSSLLLFGTGMIGLAGVVRRKLLA
jgi:PEP-CTERM motif